MLIPRIISVEDGKSVGEVLLVERFYD